MNNSIPQNLSIYVINSTTYESESEVVKITNQMEDYLIKAMKIISYSILIIQATPFINYFLRLINFWAICSLYAILNI